MVDCNLLKSIRYW